MKRYKAIAEYYDSEYEHLAFLQQDVPFFVRQLPKDPQDVLEIAAGTGRAAIPISQAGHRVVGVDYAGDMLDIANRKRDSVGLTERDCRFIRQDATKLNLRRKFDWACIFFNTFLGFVTLKEQDALLRGVHRHLRPRGRLWIDMFNPDMAMLAPRAMDGLDPVAFHVPHLNRSIMRTTEIFREDPTLQIQRITFRYRWFDDHGREQNERVRFELTFMHVRELEILLNRNGFILEKAYGDYRGGRLSTRSDRIIALCRKS